MMTLDEYYKAMLEAQLGAGNIAAIGKDAANQEQRAANWTQMSAQPAGSGWAGALAQGLRGGMAGYSTSKADKAQNAALVFHRRENAVFARGDGVYRRHFRLAIA